MEDEQQKTDRERERERKKSFLSFYSIMFLASFFFLLPSTQVNRAIHQMSMRKINCLLLGMSLKLFSLRELMRNDFLMRFKEGFKLFVVKH